MSNTDSFSNSNLDIFSSWIFALILIFYNITLKLYWSWLLSLFFYTHWRIFDWFQRNKRERERERHRSVTFCMWPEQISNPRPSYLPWWELNPQPFSVQDNGPNNWTTWLGLISEFSDTTLYFVLQVNALLPSL